MGSRKRLPKLPNVNWKLLITMFLIIIVVATTVIKCVPNFMSGGNSEVEHVVLDKEQIPEAINEILPRYRMLERALAAKVDDDIYIIVTRGEKQTAGYDVNVEKVEIIEENDEKKLIVHAIFKDPNPDDMVTQSMTYPYVVVKTELKELPPKIDLQIVQHE